MARPKAKKKAAKSVKPAKARGGAVKKAVAAVKKAVSARKSSARKGVPSGGKAGAKKTEKNVTGSSVKKTATKKLPASNAAPRKSAPKKAASKAVVKKPTTKKSVPMKSTANTAAKVPASKAKSAPAKGVKAPARKGKVGKALVRTQAVAASPAPRAVRAAPSGSDGKPGQPLQPGKIPTEAQLRRAPENQYMNDTQLAFFQQRLMQMRSEVLAREIDVKERLHQREVFADPADRASAEEEHWLDLRLRERESLLLRKIDDALRRIRDKEYGFCEKTGEPIGIARLLARPTATVCVDVKGQNERAESQYRDR